MALDPLLIGSWRNQAARLAPSHSSRPVRVATGGASGSRVHAVSASSSDTAANTLRLYLAQRLTAQADMGVGSFVDNGASPDTITRTVGSFVTDGWMPDDVLIVRGATTRANDFAAVLSAVTATTLTFPTAIVAAAEAMPAGSELWRGFQLSLSTLAANAGNLGATNALDVLSSDKPFIDGSPDRFIMLPSGWGLFAGAGNALGTGEYIDVVAFMGDY